MLANQFQTETVQGPDVGGFEQGQLLLPVAVGGVALGLLFEPCPDPVPHLGSGGLGEGDHQDFLDGGGGGSGSGGEAAQAALHEGVGFARAGACREQDVAGGCDGLFLCGGETHNL